MSRYLLIALALTLTVAAVTWPQLPSRCQDSSWYRLMADGRGDEAVRPYANRVLHTGLASGIRGLTGCGVDTAFHALGLISLLVLLFSLLLLLKDLGPLSLQIAIFASPLLIVLFRDNSLPDLTHAALTALAFLAMRRSVLLAMPLLLLLGLAREGSILLAVVFAIVLWRDGRRLLSPVALAATLGGAAVAWGLSGDSGTLNAHQIDGWLYVLFKIPFNLSRNVLGLEIWVNTIDYCNPIRVWILPDWLSRGVVKSIGICGFNAQRPLYLAVHALCTFGVLPALLLGFRRREGCFLSLSAPVWVRTALLYGLAILVLTPALGAATGRLLGYGWPAFWLAAPVLIRPILQDWPDRSRLIPRLVAVHLICGWLLLLVRVDPASILWLGVVFLPALALNVAAYRTCFSSRNAQTTGIRTHSS